MRTGVPGGGDLPRGRAAREVGAVREDQLRVRRRRRRREQAHRRVRDRAQRPEPTPGIETRASGKPSGQATRGGLKMPQQAWSDKRERQYEHIKESAQERGASTKRAKEIAARTVNKERARSGEARERSRSS